jgi:hypothetical protein
VEPGFHSNDTLSPEHPDINLRSTLEHFSVYALDATSGHVLWRHDGLDVRPEQFIKALPQHAYKLDTRDLMVKSHHAPGINDWSLFRQSLIGELPHRWHSREDTSLRLAHFVRRHIGSGSEHQAKRPKGQPTDPAVHKGRKASVKRRVGMIMAGEGSRFTGIEVPPLSEAAILPHDASEHMDHPNVFVAHTSKGLEVISLTTGMPITSLALAKGRSFADLDGDGVVDSVLVLEKQEDLSFHGDAFAHSAGEMQHCAIMVTSGLPPKSQLFNGTLCQNRNSLHDPVKLYAEFNGRIPAKVSATAPLILKKIDPKTLQESKLKDLIVSVNTGITTSYSGNGDFNWQIKNTPQWSTDYEISSALLFDSDASRMHELGTHDSVHAQVLITGEGSFALLSREGEMLATATIPKIPILAPIFGDFDSDGVTDVVIVTNEAILGFRLEVLSSTRSSLIAVVLLSLIAIIAFIANIRAEANESTSLLASKKGVLSLLRSTDDHHID